MTIIDIATVIFQKLFLLLERIKKSLPNVTFYTSKTNQIFVVWYLEGKYLSNGAKCCDLQIYRWRSQLRRLICISGKLYSERCPPRKCSWGAQAFFYNLVLSIYRAGVWFSMYLSVYHHQHNINFSYFNRFYIPYKFDL